MIRHVLIYGSALAVLALIVEAIELGHAVYAVPTSIFALSVAVLFAALGIWLGTRLVPAPRSAPFSRNEMALAALKISPRECDVLDLMAEGASTKQIARRLAISPNTVKTHTSRLFEKLDAHNRTQLVGKARALDLLP